MGIKCLAQGHNTAPQARVKPCDQESDALQAEHTLGAVGSGSALFAQPVCPKIQDHYSTWTQQFQSLGFLCVFLSLSKQIQHNASSESSPIKGSQKSGFVK